MTIGFDASRAFVEGRTGTENYSYQLLKALAKIDTKNNYLIYIRKSQESRVKSQEWSSNYKFRIINYKFLWTQIGLALQTFLDPLDLLFVPSHTLPLIRKPGLKTVITVHDLGVEYLPDFHQLKQVLYLKFMTNYQLKTASKIIAVSKASKNDLVKKIGILGEKIEVIYEGVDKSIFTKVSKDIVSDIVKKFDIEREKYFLFVGTIQPRKNLERLIKAFKKFSDMITDERLQIKEKDQKKSLIINHKSLFKLILVGQKGWKSDSIYSLSKELGIEENVRFLGRISEKDLIGLYNGAIALVYPSLFEGFGLPILEAFACGCPVITSNISSMPEVGGEAAILVNPYKVEEITDAMLEISRNDKLRAGLIAKGYNRNKSFDWEKCARETVEIFNEVMKK